MDAHVGQYLLENVILGALKEKTRIIATHAIHLTASADQIICMENGSIVERGSYSELISSNGTFARLAREFGGSREETANETSTEKKSSKEVDVNQPLKKSSKLMQTEERSTGGVSGKVYADYLRAGRAMYTAPIILITLILMQTSQGVSLFSLTWFQDNLFNRSNAFYVSYTRF